MSSAVTLTRTRMRTPRSAAVAGIIFSVLLMTIFFLLRMFAPADPLEPSAWLVTGSGAVTLALNLVPFAGICFLWFIGVLRDRLGQLEDRFFATVFFGSALLFLGTLFAAAAVVGAIILVFAAEPDQIMTSTSLRFARALAYSLMNIYAIKMAGVFMISTSTLAIYTGLAPRWLALLRYVSAAVLLLGSSYITWGFMVLPLWVLLLSIHVLVDNFRGSGWRAEAGAAESVSMP